MHIRPIIPILLAGMLASGCAGQPFAYHDANQIPQGPGLVSGEDGAFRLTVNDLGRWNEDRKQKQ